LSTLQLEPAAHAVGPVHPLPPHWPYLVWALPAGGAVVLGAATVLVLRVVLDDDGRRVTLETGVTTAEVVVGAEPPPPGRVAEAVAVAVDLLWGMELTAPAMRAGPGTGYWMSLT